MSAPPSHRPSSRPCAHRPATGDSPLAEELCLRAGWLVLVTDLAVVAWKVLS